jgi:hypothetical protein
MSWLKGKLDVNARWPHISLSWTNTFLGFSYFALLVMNLVACGVVISIPAFVYIGLIINSPESRYTLDNANLAAISAVTISLMNCTFNFLNFYWKNKVLRSEGLKVLKSLKICRRLES